MLVFSAFTPHTPVLLDEIGQDKTNKLSKTLEAFASLESELYAAMPQTIIVIGGHSNIDIDFFRIPYSESFRTSFKEVGDYSLHKDFRANLPLTQLIKERSIGNFPVNLLPEKSLDYGISAPLHLLVSRIQGIKIVPIHHSLLSLDEHRKFGAMLREIIEDTTERIAVIATGELSHNASKSSDKKQNAGEQFDKFIIESLRSGSYKDIFNLEDDFLAKVQECGLRPLAILLGILEGHAEKAEILNYESPLGVGHLTVDFKIR